MLRLFPATLQDLPEIKALLESLDLISDRQTFDNFVVARLTATNFLAGVACLEEYSDLFFLSSFGIAAKLQGQGLGKDFLNQLLNGLNKPVYLRTIIPGFFTRAGFLPVAEPHTTANSSSTTPPKLPPPPPKDLNECQWCESARCTLMVKLPHVTKIS